MSLLPCTRQHSEACFKSSLRSGGPLVVVWDPYTNWSISLFCPCEFHSCISVIILTVSSNNYTKLWKILIIANWSRFSMVLNHMFSVNTWLKYFRYKISQGEGRFQGCAFKGPIVFLFCFFRCFLLTNELTI